MEFKINVFRDVLIYLEQNLLYGMVIDSCNPPLKIKDYSQDDIAYHIELLYEVGFIKADEISVNGMRYKIYMIERLTYAGHEFLASTRNDTVWKKMQEGASFIGIEIIKSSIPILLAYAKTQLGIP